MSVPYVSGYSVEQATDILEDAGFFVTNGGYVDSAVARGAVAYSAPGSGTMFGSGDTITLYISDGTPPKQPKPPRNDNGGGNDGGGERRRRNGNGNGNGNGGGRGNG